LQKRGHIRQIERIGEAQLCRRLVPYRHSLHRLQEVIAHMQDFRPQRARADLALLGRVLDRHDDVALDLQNPTFHRLRNFRAPSLLNAQVAAIADHHRRALREGDRQIVGRTAAHRECNTTLRQGRAGLAQTFQHEGIVPGIRVRISIGQSKADEDRKVEPIGRGDGSFQCRVERFALRLLHPIEDVLAPRLRRVVKLLEPLGFDHEKTRCERAGSAKSRGRRMLSGARGRKYQPWGSGRASPDRIASSLTERRRDCPPRSCPSAGR
jgi:hypothetical protein